MTAPAVSICMVTYGALEWVQRAVAAIHANTAEAFELIIVDNGSTDGTREWLRAESGAAALHESDHNLGFAGGTNLAINLARAPHLCLLNSDALVGPGWLKPLVAALEAERDIGVVVPMFVNLDGSVQEAGSNVDQDGRVEAFAIRGDPADPELSWPRRVTYGSAACWVMRTATYRSLGGLDCGYGTAYYEDVDLAFTMRARGLRVEYVPTVRVVHAQGASSPSSNAAEQQRDSNQARFASRHAALLAHHWHTYDPPNEPHRYFAARDVDVSERTLVVVDAIDDQLDLATDADHRVTIVVLGDTDVGARELWCQRGVEVLDTRPADGARLLEERQFHYSTVAAPAVWLTEQADAIALFQPQAELVAR
jgi:GT2 family glycosyltransferase